MARVVIPEDAAMVAHHDLLVRQRPYFDLGHQGDFDYTQIRQFLAMTPSERLEHHEGWRLFVRGVASNAKLIRRGHRAPDGGPS